MPKIVHLANTDFEFELAMEGSSSLMDRWVRHPFCFQLQYLPLLYAEPDEVIAVSSLPDERFLSQLLESEWWQEGIPKMTLFDDKESLIGSRCLPWGSSPSMKEWVCGQGMIYEGAQDWPMIRLINSKAFSFRYTTLAHATLTHNASELRDWANKVEGEKVVKTFFGLSGKGNRRFTGEATDKIFSFCEREWQQSRAVVCEPWVDRTADFSTQWHIHRDGTMKCIGATRFLTDQRGSYQGTYAGPEQQLFAEDAPFLNEHKRRARLALGEIAAMGYFGFVGVDAMVYREASRELLLCPIVEINARRTMSLAILQFQQKRFPNGTLKLSFQRHIEPRALSILPDQVETPSQTLHFRHQLILKKMDEFPLF